MAINVNIGQATETDLAQAITVTKSITLGQATETDFAQPITWTKTPRSEAIGYKTDHQLISYP